MLNDIKIELPSWIGEVKTSNFDIGANETLAKVMTLANGLEKLSLEDFQANPELLPTIQRKISEIATDVGVEPVTFVADDFFQGVNDEIDVDPNLICETRISQENVLIELVAGAIRKIIDFLKSLKDWFVGLFSKGKVTAKAQEVAMSKATEQLSKNVTTLEKTNPNKEMQGENMTAVVRLPTKAYVLFHTPKHTPKIGYRYNDSNLESAIKGVMGNMTAYLDALDDEVNTILNVVGKSIDDVLRGNPIPTTLMYQLTRSRVLLGYAHNKFECIGFGLISKPFTNEEINRDKYDVTNCIQSHGWSTGDSFELSINLKTISKQAEGLNSNVNSLNQRILSIQDKLSKHDAIKRLSQIKDYQKVMGNVDGDALDARTLRRLTVLQNLASQTQLLVASTQAYIVNYNNIALHLVMGIQRAIAE